VASEKKPCADVAVRIGLQVTAGGQYQFDNSWEVRWFAQRVWGGSCCPR
jgi:hypothetical protein